jgi:hypothetical protein
MRVRTFIQTTLRSLAVLFICSFMYVQFLTTPILHFLSMKEWSIIGFIAAIAIGVVCRLLVRNRSTMVFLAIAGLVGGSIFTAVYYTVHDTAASSTWFSYIRSALYTWPYASLGLLAIMGGWHFDGIHSSRRRFRHS